MNKKQWVQKDWMQASRGYRQHEVQVIFFAADLPGAIVLRPVVAMNDGQYPKSSLQSCLAYLCKEYRRYNPSFAEKDRYACGFAFVTQGRILLCGKFENGCLVMRDYGSNSSFFGKVDQSGKLSRIIKESLGAKFVAPVAKKAASVL